MNYSRIFSLFIPLVFASFPAHAKPKQIVFTRHAEKKKNSGSENHDGEVRVRGCDRAFALPSRFSFKPQKGEFDAPVAVYSVMPSPDYRALRATQTAAPTAARFGSPLIVTFTKDQYSEIARDILENPKYNGKTVLVVWEHHVIPKLVAAFGFKAEEDPRTADWPDDVFDQMWVLNYDQATGKVKDLQIVPEDLEPGDNPAGGLNAWKKGRNIADDATVCALSSNQAQRETLPGSPCKDNGVLNALVSDLSPGLLDKVAAMPSAFDKPTGKKVPQDAPASGTASH